MISSFFTMRHYSFMLSRPGVKPGHYVPFRLRIVDTVTFFSGIQALLMAIIVSTFCTRLAQQAGLMNFGRNPWAYIGCFILVLYIATWIFYLRGIGILRVLFLCLGMMTREEAQYYPLEVSKKRFDPWPECWQKASKGN